MSAAAATTPVTETKRKRVLSPEHIASLALGAKKGRLRMNFLASNRFKRRVLNPEVEKRKRLRELLDIALGLTGKGARVTLARVAMALGAYFVDSGATGMSAFMKSELSNGNRVSLASEVSGLCPRTVRDIVAKFEFTGTIKLEADGTRGSAAASYECWPHPPEGAQEALKVFFDEMLIENAKTPVWITCKVVQQFMHDRYMLNFSPTTTSRILKAWGYSYGPLTRLPRGERTVGRMMQKRLVTLQMDDALKRGSTLIFMDQSYANERLGWANSWGPADSMHAAWVPKGGLGQRLCFIHALSRDGLLVARDKDGNVIPEPLGVGPREFSSAGMFFPATKTGKDVDYHGNFNADLFLAWVRDHFIPTLKTYYPKAHGAHSTQVIEILADNAQYQISCSGATFDENGNVVPQAPGAIPSRFDPSFMNRAELIGAMLSLGCDSVDVDYRVSEKGKPDSFIKMTVKFDAAAMAVKRAGKGVARLNELREACTAWLAKNCPSVLANDFEAMLAAAGNFRVIWNSPNFPEGNAIELVWAQGKLYASVKFNGKRNMVQLLCDISEGLYSDRLANEVAGFVRGGSFVSGPDGTCPSAAKLVDHVLYSHTGNGFASVIKNDPELNVSPTKVIGKLSGVKGRYLEAATKAINRKTLRFLTKELLATDLGLQKAEEEMMILDDDEDEDDDDN